MCLHSSVRFRSWNCWVSSLNLQISSHWFILDLGKLWIWHRVLFQIYTSSRKWARAWSWFCIRAQDDCQQINEQNPVCWSRADFFIDFHFHTWKQFFVLHELGYEFVGSIFDINKSCIDLFYLVEKRKEEARAWTFCILLLGEAHSRIAVINLVMKSIYLATLTWSIIWKNCSVYSEMQLKSLLWWKIHVWRRIKRICNLFHLFFTELSV